MNLRILTYIYLYFCTIFYLNLRIKSAALKLHSTDLVRSKLLHKFNWIRYTSTLQCFTNVPYSMVWNRILTHKIITLLKLTQKADYSKIQIHCNTINKNIILNSAKKHSIILYNAISYLKKQYFTTLFQLFTYWRSTTAYINKTCSNLVYTNNWLQQSP